MNLTVSGQNDFALLFVYGSLKRGFALHDHLRDQIFLGETSTQPTYRLFDCGPYPAMVKVAANGVRVKGEVFQVSHHCLTQLDEVEGVPEGLYSREPVDLEADFLPAPVLTYLYRQSTASLADCGTVWPAAPQT
ncbi:MAG: gamma-glutamylcyclotransferase family protein [Fuerstiella sp.]